jgi:hypothetical protein
VIESRDDEATGWLTGLVLAATMGAFIGVLELWFFEFSLAGLLAAAAAGASFAVVWCFLAMGRPGAISRSRTRAILAAPPAGGSSGIVWWLIAAPSASIWLAVVIGATLGTIAVIFEA